jgi:hypothetical protein
MTITTYALAAMWIIAIVLVAWAAASLGGLIR